MADVDGEESAERLREQWEFSVAADGRSASLRVPTGAVITSFADGHLWLNVPKAASETVTGAAGKQVGADPPVWTVELAEQVLRGATDSGVQLIRALVAAGGTATVDQLRERTGITALGGARNSLTMSAKFALQQSVPDGAAYRHFFAARPGSRRRGTVHDYHLPGDLVPVFRDALARLDAAPYGE